MHEEPMLAPIYTEVLSTEKNVKQKSPRKEEPLLEPVFSKILQNRREEINIETLSTGKFFKQRNRKSEDKPIITKKKKKKRRDDSDLL